jgi:hypothetical protein
MGNLHGVARCEEAIEKLEDIIWDPSLLIQLRHVKTILDECNICTTDDWKHILNDLSAKEKEHEAKCIFFMRKGAEDLFRHHSRMSWRYGRILFLLRHQCGFSNYIEQY